MAKDNQAALSERLTQQTNRAKESQTARRRRHTDDPYDGVQFHLGVSPHIKEGDASEENYAYYWANDDKGRVQYLTEQDDWDFVEDREANQDPRNKGGGTRIERVVGRGRDGLPVRAVYLRKRRDYYTQDQAIGFSRLDARAARVRSGILEGASGSDIMANDPRHAYIPSEINTTMPRIKRA
jgi:hypothetical protein